MSGRLALEPLTPGARTEFVGTRRVVAGLDPGARPGRVACRGSVTTLDELADALTAALRGAAVLVTVHDSMRDRLLDEAERAGIDTVEPAATLLQPEWAPLLEGLAQGMAIGDAAERCHMSQRTAYRRLGEARRALGVTSTTAAVALWAAGERPPAPD